MLNGLTAPLITGAKLAQIAWVVPDIKAAEQFFRNTMGVTSFHKAERIRAQDSKATYYGEPADFVTHAYNGYANGIFLELIEPVSGRSVFRDYLDQHPRGGLQHMGYRLPINGFDAAVAELAARGYPVISTFDTSIAQICFFDTYKDLGVAMEVMGVTPEGEQILGQMEKGFQ